MYICTYNMMSGCGYKMPTDQNNKCLYITIYILLIEQIFYYPID